MFNFLVVDRGEVEFKLPAIDDVYEVEAVLDYAKEKDDVSSTKYMYRHIQLSTCTDTSN